MRLIALILGNVLALFLASYYIAGVAISGGWQGALIVGLVFSAVNFFLKPLLKLLLGPIILLTLGIFILVINMGVLWVTDLLLPQMSIASIGALFLATLLVSAVNFATHIVFRK
ncbi:phage holin family protein [Candidatus Azambacteria bacterium]|nr:phage holin family protein [Candidatus Azambacteria bacterium]